MEKLSLEQRAHDIALLAIQIDTQSKLNGSSGTYNIDVVSSYISAYNDALDALVKLKKDVHPLED